MPEHGGALRAVAQDSTIPLECWLDLSTGINPISWQPRAPVPIVCWQRLPESDDGLEAAARSYYGAKTLLPVAGSQAAIQMLPQLRTRCRVGLAARAYNEHGWCWQRVGHQVIVLDEPALDQLEAYIPQLDVLLLINPTNPTGRCFELAQLLAWHQQLAARGGWLVVDEAFIDCTPAQSLAAFCDRPGLIVLRSVGKFFGLAGARVGFVLAEKTLLEKLAERLGPWTVAGPSRWLVAQALEDSHWQQQMQDWLPLQSARLAELLSAAGLESVGSALFQYVPHPQASRIASALAGQGILVRQFSADEHGEAALRFGLPGTDPQWKKLEQVLISIMDEIKFEKSE